MQKSKVIIGTRGSKLALWQANYTQNLLAQNNISSEIKIIQTKGDASQTWNTSFDKLEGKGFFTKELEEALLAQEIDLAVHSCKDLPTQFPLGLTIAAYSKRANPFDVLLINKQKVDISKTLSLQKNALVGTSSSRRKAQLLAYRNDIEIKDIRGNVPTRIEKLRNGEFDAIVLAQAGIDRLEINTDDFFVFPLVSPMFVPAAAQGILAYQIRENDENMQQICTLLNDANDAEISGIERKILNAFDGGCQIPLGIFTKQEDNQIHIWISYAKAWNEIPIRMHFKFNHTHEIYIKNIVDKIKQHTGKSVFISRNSIEDDYLENTLNAHQYSVQAQSLLQFNSVDFSIEEIKNIDWIFFSSKHAIDFFIQKIDQSILKNIKIAVLGLGTAAHLNKYQIQADFVGDGLGRTTAKLFENTIDGGVTVLFPCATQSLYQVQRHFTNNKINVENLAVYENAMIENVPKSNAAILVFTSPMNVRAYFSTYQKEATQKVISIGKTTSEVLSEFAVQHQVAYAPYNYCLVDEIMSL